MVEVQETDFVIVGAGIAGLRAAIGLAADGARVLVVTKEALGQSNTNYAQGGIAVAMSGDEDVALLRHARAMANITLMEWTCTVEVPLPDGVAPRVGVDFFAG